MPSLDCLAVGGRKDSIEGETYSKIPVRLQEHSLDPSESPLVGIYRTRSSAETPRDPANDFATKSRGKNNHYCRSDRQSRAKRQIHQRSHNASLPPRNSIRAIINRSRLCARRSFKFRRKRDGAPSKPVELADDVDEIISDDGARHADNPLFKLNIEQILQQQWIQVFQQKESKRMNASTEKPRRACHFSALSLLDENDSCFTTDDESLDQSRDNRRRSAMLNPPNSSSESTLPDTSKELTVWLLSNTNPMDQKSISELTNKFRGKHRPNQTRDPLR